MEGISRVVVKRRKLIVLLTLLLLNRFIEKTKHRKFIPEFGRIAKTAVKVRVPVFIAVLAISGFCYIAQSKNSFTYGSGDAAGNTAEAVAIKEKFGENNIMVLLVPKGDVTRLHETGNGRCLKGNGRPVRPHLSWKIGSDKGSYRSP